MQFKKTRDYIATLNLATADPLDCMIASLLDDEAKYERASQALRRRFVRGAYMVPAIDRGGRFTNIKREGKGKSYEYFVQGLDSSWSSPDERIWVVAMYALWQESN